MRTFGFLLVVAILFLATPVNFGTIGCGTDFASAGAGGCCKMCVKGKACGNSCIARWKTCHKGAGCACNADLNNVIGSLFETSDSY